MFLERSEEHTSELQSHSDRVCRLLLETLSSSAIYALSLHDALPIFQREEVVAVPERILQFLQHPTIRTSGRNAGGDHVRHDKHARERYASDPVFLEAAILRPCFWKDRKSTRLNSSHTVIAYAVFCLKRCRHPQSTLFPYTTLFRSFSEKRSLQFRSEFFNFFNTPQFGLPDGTLGATTFGTISTLANDMRQIQFSLKLLF